MKATAIAPSNIAFIKYWGKKDSSLRIPSNGSISMNLSGLTTTTTVEFDKKLPTDCVTIDNTQNESETKRVSEHLNRIRKLAAIQTRARVASINSFPSSTGLSSSASGFAALTVAGTHAAGLTLEERELSILARLGSGSACRSVPDGFVEWLGGESSDTSYAVSIFPPDYFDIVDIVVITNTGKKEISTTKGMDLAHTSPFFQSRLLHMNKKIALCKTFIKNKDFTTFGSLIEQEALNMHAVMMTSDPPLLYIRPQTLSIMKEVQNWRKEGIETYFTINTGQDVHIICKPADVKSVKSRLKKISGVSDTIVSKAADGARLSTSHLF